MPRINQQILDTTFYLYESREAAEKGASFGGTGFLVGVPVVVPEHPEGALVRYAVSNWHVAVSDGFSVIRLHKKDGTTRIVETDPSDWSFISNGNDIAVIPIGLDVKKDQFAVIPTSMFVNQSDGVYGIGDDVFMVGRFIDHGGIERNNPAVRFGNISMMPQEIKSGPSYRLSYCIDMHSRSGFSGSPVFVYRTPGSDFSDQSGKIVMDRRLNFLGIHWGQFLEEWEIAEHSSRLNTEASLDTDGKFVKGMSGMTCVAPAWDILKVFDMPELRTQREEAIKQFVVTEKYKHALFSDTYQL